ncbi:hypothetical protein [Desulfospira joergensenii]|uniref:hypothetical protein n=1 Tax=Desulfospira joergensenii TaxID=53329 RepID=UPI0004840C4C|nr:hypothetical protein [Desulfospira joergensenii]
MDIELRQTLRRNWIECIHHFASPKLQKLWVSGHPEILVTFTECMCQYFDDLNLSDGLKSAVYEGWLNQDEVQIVTKFHELADKYNPTIMSDQNVLDDPKWNDIVREAQKAWIALKKHLTDRAELDFMKELEQQFEVTNKIDS